MAPYPSPVLTRTLRHQALAAELSPSLLHLNLAHNEIGADACGAVARALQNNSNLKRLSMAGNLVGDQAALALLSGIGPASPLLRLDLKVCPATLALRSSRSWCARCLWARALFRLEVLCGGAHSKGARRHVLSIGRVLAASRPDTFPASSLLVGKTFAAKATRR